MTAKFATIHDLQNLRREILDEVEILFDVVPPTLGYVRQNEACRLLQVSNRCLYNFRKAGLPTLKVGKLVYLRVDDINAFLASHQTKKPQQPC